MLDPSEVLDTPYMQQSQGSRRRTFASPDLRFAPVAGLPKAKLEFP